MYYVESQPIRFIMSYLVDRKLSAHRNDELLYLKEL